MPLNFKKLLAIAPTIIRLSVFSDNLDKIFILVDTFEPPIIHVIGFFLSSILNQLIYTLVLKVAHHNYQ